MSASIRRPLAKRGSARSGIATIIARPAIRRGVNNGRRMTDRFETLAVHAGAEPDPHTGAVVPAIEMSTTFKQDGVGGLRAGFDYGRSGNPTRSALETAIATLEGGTHGLAYASGLAATQNILYLLDPGDRLLMSDDVYGGTWRLADKVWRRYGVETDVLDLRDLDAVAAAFGGEPAPRMVWIETPSNPLLKVIDISAVARLAAVAGALTVVDNTFATPYLQRPLGRHRRPDRDALRRGRGEAPLPPERRRRRAEPVRLLPRHARPADAGDSDGTGIGQRAGPRPLARGAPRGRAPALSGNAGPSGGGARRAPDAGARRHAQHRAARRRGAGEALRGRDAPVHARRVAR